MRKLVIIREYICFVGLDHNIFEEELEQVYESGPEEADFD
jgi:hypothetical protein